MKFLKSYKTWLWVFIIALAVWGLFSIISRDMTTRANQKSLSQERAKTMNGRQFRVMSVKVGEVPEKAFARYEIIMEDTITRDRQSWAFTSTHNDCLFDKFNEMRLVPKDLIELRINPDESTQCDNEQVFLSYMNPIRIIED